MYCYTSTDAYTFNVCSMFSKLDLIRFDSEIKGKSTDIVGPLEAISTVRPELICSVNCDVVGVEIGLEEICIIAFRVTPVAAGVSWKRTVIQTVDNCTNKKRYNNHQMAQLFN